MTTVCCPVEPHELTKDMRLGMMSIVHRVTAASAVRGAGMDLLLRVYLAGVYHGQALAAQVGGHPKGGDAVAAPFMTDAVGEADAPLTPSDHTIKGRQG